MAKGINQKGKILYLEKILRETSETTRIGEIILPSLAMAL